MVGDGKGQALLSTVGAGMIGKPGAHLRVLRKGRSRTSVDSRLVFHAPNVGLVYEVKGSRKMMK